MAFCEVFALILYKSWGLLWCEGIIKSALQTDLVAVVRVVTLMMSVMAVGMEAAAPSFLLLDFQTKISYILQ